MAASLLAHGERARALAAADPPRQADAARGLEEAMGRLGSIPSLSPALCDVEVQRGRRHGAIHGDRA